MGSENQPLGTIQNHLEEIDYKKVQTALTERSPYGLNEYERRFFTEVMFDNYKSVAEAVKRDKGELDKFHQRYNRRKRLADFPDPKPEEENANALFPNGWLRKGGGAFFVSVSGAGKSVAQTQFALCWALGREWMGIRPIRPLSISVYQAEDDEDEVAEFRNNIRRGLIHRERWTDMDTIKAEEQIVYHDVTGLSGDTFINYVAQAQEEDKSDLLVFNPFQSFMGADISDNANVTRFLRCQLDPILRNEQAPCAVLIVHHTTKVSTNPKDRAGWLDLASAAYAGAGGAELVNWARAVLTLRPYNDAQGIYDLIAAKRGKRLDWKDANGKPTIVKTIAHTDGLMFWHEATPEEILAAKSNSVAPSDQERKRLVAICEKNGKPFKTKQALIDAAQGAKLGGRNAILSLINECVNKGELREGETIGRAIPIGTPNQLPLHTPEMPDY